MQREKSNNKKEKNIEASRKMQNFYHAVFLGSRPAERMLKKKDSNVQKCIESKNVFNERTYDIINLRNKF